MIRWAILLCVIGGGLTEVHLLPGGRVGSGLWWAGAGALLLMFLWARRAQFVCFHPQSHPTKEITLPSRGKHAVRAAGRMSVGKRERWVIGDHGYVERFRSGEFAVTAFVSPSRYLGLGGTRREDEGMWYVFIPPKALEHTVAGTIRINGRVYPGVAVRYRVEKDRRVVYLAFPSETK